MPRYSSYLSLNQKEGVSKLIDHSSIMLQEEARIRGQRQFNMRAARPQTPRQAIACTPCRSPLGRRWKYLCFQIAIGYESASLPYLLGYFHLRFLSVLGWRGCQMLSRHKTVFMPYGKNTYLFHGHLTAPRATHYRHT